MRARAAGITVLLAAGLVGAIGSAADAATATAKLGYTCRFTSGDTTVGITITATFPDSVTAGKPFRPTNVSTALSIPHTTLAGLGNATSVTTTTELTVKIAQERQSADAGWFGTAPTTHIPGTGALDLTAAGDVPSVTVHGTGPVTFTAGELTMTLSPDDSADKPVDATCKPAAGQRAVLARVPTTGPGGGPSTTPTPTASSASNPSERGASSQRPRLTPGLTTPGNRTAQVNPADAHPAAIDSRIYNKCMDLKTYADHGLGQGTYITAITNVRKLHSATVAGFPEPAFARSGPNDFLWSGAFEDPDTNWVCQRLDLELDHDGKREFPIVAATASAFGFVPVTADAHITQVGDTPATAVTYEDGLKHTNSSGPYTVVSTAVASLRLSDVRVNGVPLNVGTDCRTSRPLYTPDNPADPNKDRIALTGGDHLTDPTPIFGSVLYGGAVAGQVTIPPFKGCVTSSGDNIDKLLTASISGPGNDAKLVAGLLCGVDPLCDRQTLRPHQQATWTLTHGGPFSAGSAPLSLELHPSTPEIPPTTISCTGADLSGVAYNSIGALRGSLADANWTNIHGCTDTTGATWTVEQQASTGLVPVKVVGTPRFRWNLQLVLHRTGADACSATLTGPVGVIYNNDTGRAQIMNVVLSAAGEAMRATTSTCPNIPAYVRPPQGTLIVTNVIANAEYTLPADQAFTVTSP